MMMMTGERKIKLSFAENQLTFSVKRQHRNN